jgi:DNA repair protein RAD5
MDEQNSPPSDSFFAGPDEDDATMAIDDFADVDRSSPSIPQTPQTLSSHASPPQEKLFLDDSDDDVAIPEEDFLNLKRSQAVMMEDTDNSDIEIVEQTDKADITLSRSNSHRPSLSPKPHKSSYSNQAQKKRRLSPEADVAGLSSCVLPAYLGEVLVPNAWSTTSGRGVVKPNDIINVRREHDDEAKTLKSKSKGSHGANSKKKTDNKKQVTLTSMMGAQSQKFSKKKKPDTIVRLVTKDDVG